MTDTAGIDTAGTNAAGPATARFGLDPAPPELRLTQELLNTTGTRQHEDLLGSIHTARDWFVEIYPDGPRLGGKKLLGMVDLMDLLEMRAILRRLVRREPAELVGSVDIRVDAEQAVVVPSIGTVLDTGAAWPTAPNAGEAGATAGQTGSTASGTGWSRVVTPHAGGADWLRSAILAECLLARALGSWSRLKLCRNHGCPVAFYDVSRNGSRIWHDVSTCGNAANVRAHRARNRTFG